MPHTQDIVQKLWNLCNILKDDGVTYQDYVTELTFLLFLKMAQETNREGEIPEGYRWTDLESKNEAKMLTFYRELLLHLGTKPKNQRVLEIFANASTSLRQPRHLKELVTQIDKIEWYEAREEGTRRHRPSCLPANRRFTGVHGGARPHIFRANPAGPR